MPALPETKNRRRIYLLRHGHVDYITAGKTGMDWKEVPLTDLGQSQATASGKALASVSFDRAICSGYPRTVQTAERVLTENRNETPILEVDADFRETSVGSAGPSVKSIQELTLFMTASFDDAHEPEAKIGMAEDADVFLEVQERALKALKRLLEDDSWTTCLIAAHEGINRLILSWAVGSGLRSAGRIEQDLAGINIIDFDPADPGWDDKALGLSIGYRPIVKSINLTPYDWVKEGMPMTSFEFIFKTQ